MGGTSEVSKENLSIGKKELVTSIAGVINSTAGVEPKTQKIQLIVIAAVHRLGLTGLTWEEVRDELKARSSQEACG